VVFFGDSLQDVTRFGDCTLRLQFRRFIDHARTVGLAELDVRLKLKDAELDAVVPDGKSVVLRMLSPASVNVKWNERMFDGKTIDGKSFEVPTQESWVKVRLPAYDEEEARRLSRALNLQIQSCGGKRDPFAK
jgi:hypothetical protein